MLIQNINLALYYFIYLKTSFDLQSGLCPEFRVKEGTFSVYSGKLRGLFIANICVEIILAIVWYLIEYYKVTGKKTKTASCTRV